MCVYLSIFDVSRSDRRYSNEPNLTLGIILVINFNQLPYSCTPSSEIYATLRSSSLRLIGTYWLTAAVYIYPNTLRGQALVTPKLACTYVLQYFTAKYLHGDTLASIVPRFRWPAVSYLFNFYSLSAKVGYARWRQAYSNAIPISAAVATQDRKSVV